MDLKKHPNLDPKLKETYDRIMGTSVGVKPPVHTPAPDHETPHEAPHLSHIAYHADGTKKATPAPQPHTAPTHAQPTVVSHDSLLLPLLLGIGGVIFFVAYSIFWMRYFGL